MIAPLSTSVEVAESYGGDEEHFSHVLDHLFAPAISKAGYAILGPRARGAYLIPVEIIRNLKEAEVALCDVSTLNANVFFELGIRTTQDRPVAIAYPKPLYVCSDLAG